MIPGGALRPRIDEGAGLSGKGEKLHRAALALSVGAIGAGVALWLNLPLAMLIGPLLATMIGAVTGMNLAVPHPLRQAAIVVVAVSLSSKFTPDLLGHMALWPISLLAVLPFIILAAWPVHGYYRRVAGFDPATALLSAIPGGLQTMIMAGPELGGDERRIIMAQVLRLMLSVLAVSLVLGTAIGLSRSQMAMFRVDTAIHWPALAGIVILAYAGFLLAQRFRVPAAQFMGVMPVLAPLYLGGWVEQDIPGPVMALCLWIVGASLGSRFSGIKLREMARFSGHSVVSVLIMLAVCLLFTVVLGVGLDLPMISVLLAFAPGGIVEMSLIALALDVDAGYVSVHHLLRIGLCTLSLPVVFHLLGRRRT